MITLKRLKRSRRRGFTLIEVMTVTTIMAGMQTSSYQGVTDRARALKCQQHLRQVGMVLMTTGALPKAAFYPTGDPKTDPKSIRVLLKGTVPEEMLVCPTAPDAMARKGLTFLWNDKLNGKNMMMAGRAWVLIEMNCLAPNPVAPHSGKYHVLYTDSSVKSVDKPPREILEAIALARKQATRKTPPPAARETGPSPTKAAAPTPAETPAVAEKPRGLKKGGWVTVFAEETPFYIGGKVAAKLKDGQELEVLDVKGAWVGVKVNLDGEWKSGWVQKSYVSE